MSSSSLLTLAQPRAWGYGACKPGPPSESQPQASVQTTVWFPKLVAESHGDSATMGEKTA